MRSRSWRRGASLAVAGLAVLGALGVGESPASGDHDVAPPAGGDGPPALEGAPTPPAQRTQGGGAVRIYGTGFGGVSAVTFGGVPAPGFTVVDGDLIVATVPPGTPGYAHVAVTDEEGTGTSDLDGDGDGEVDEPNTAGATMETLERGAILYTDATLSVSPETALGAGDPAEVALAGYQPLEDVALAQLNPLAGLLEHRPADPDDFPPGSPYGDALTLTGTDESGDNTPHDVAVRTGAGFNADDIGDYDPAAACPVTQATADYGLGRCSITASQLGMGRVERQIGLAGDPTPALPSLELTATGVADGDVVEVSGANWNAAPHFGSDTVPDGPGETLVSIDVCNAAGDVCRPAGDPAAGVDVVRYTNAADDAAGLPADGMLSGAELSGSFTVADSDVCAPDCLVRVRQERYDIAANAPVPGSFIEATAPLVPNAVPTAPQAAGISVDVTAEPTSLPGPGGEFTFTVAVANTGTDAVTVTGLAAIGASLEGRGTCVVDVVVAAGATSTCAFAEDYNGAGGDSRAQVVTVTAEDDEGAVATATGEATVTITAAVEPEISVKATANPLSLTDPGGPFTVTVEVMNTGENAVTVTELADVVYDPVTEQGSCADVVDTELAPGGRATCSFPGELVGEAGDSQVDTFTATATDDLGTEVTDTYVLTVSITE